MRCIAHHMKRMGLPDASTSAVGSEVASASCLLVVMAYEVFDGADNFQFGDRISEVTQGCVCGLGTSDIYQKQDNGGGKGTLCGMMHFRRRLHYQAQP